MVCFVQIVSKKMLKMGCGLIFQCFMYVENVLRERRKKIEILLEQNLRV